MGTNTTEFQTPPETENVFLPVPILEIGPRYTILRHYYDEHPNDEIVFVDLNPPAFRYTKYPHASYIHMDVVDYLASNHDSIPKDGFRTVVAMNVFGTSAEPIEEKGKIHLYEHRLFEFIKNLYPHLQQGGVIIIEEYMTPSDGTRDKLIAAFEGFIPNDTHDQGKRAFEVEVVTDKNHALAGNVWEYDAYQIRIRKS